jgi:hypothetical protein
VWGHEERPRGSCDVRPSPLSVSNFSFARLPRPRIASRARRTTRRTTRRRAPTLNPRTLRGISRRTRRTTRRRRRPRRRFRRRPSRYQAPRPRRLVPRPFVSPPPQPSP